MVFTVLSRFSRDPDGDFSHVIINWDDASTVQPQILPEFTGISILFR